MSDLMLSAVLRMPYELAMGHELSRYQFYQRAQEAINRMEIAEAKAVADAAQIRNQAIEDAAMVCLNAANEYEARGELSGQGWTTSMWLMKEILELQKSTEQTGGGDG